MFSNNIQIMPVAEANKKITISLYLDVDGTLTNATGQKAIEAMFPLLADKTQPNDPDYIKTRFLFVEKQKNGQKCLETDLSAMAKVILEKCKYSYYKHFAITPEAAQFLKNWLKERADANVRIYLFTKARREYVEALCLAAGLSHDEIKRLTIKDAVDMQRDHIYKDGMIANCEKSNKSDAILIADDTESDFIRMRNAAIIAGKKEVIKLLYNNAIGKFNFKQMGANLESTISATIRIKTKADLNVFDKNKRTPLFSAICLENVELVKALIKAGANVELPNGAGNYTPLMEACYGGNSEIVAALLDGNADVNAGPVDSRALDCAIAAGHEQVVFVLLKQYNVEITDRMLEIAGIDGHQGIKVRLNAYRAGGPHGPVIHPGIFASPSTPTKVEQAENKLKP